MKEHSEVVIQQEQYTYRQTTLLFRREMAAYRSRFTTKRGWTEMHGAWQRYREAALLPRTS